MSELPKEHRTVSTEAIVRVGEGRDCEFVDDDTIAALKARLAKAAASGWGNSTYQSPDEWLPQWLASQRRRDFEKWQSRVSHPELEGADAAKPARKRRSPKPMLASVAKQVSRAGIEVARYEVKPDGTVVVVTGKTGTEQTDDLDNWIAKHAHTGQRH